MSVVSRAGFLDFFKIMGQRVIVNGENSWVDVRPYVFQTAPSFRMSPPQTETEVKKIFSEGGVLALRWFSEAGQEEKKGGPLLYILRPPFDMESIEHKARNQTRRGLEKMKVEKAGVPDAALEREAWEVYRDNAGRLALFASEKSMRRKWGLWLNALRNCRDLEFWTARKDGALAAFAVTLWSPWGLEIMMQRSLKAFLPDCPNNALVYTLCRDGVERNAPLVSFGLSAYGLNAPDGLHHFKVNMGFETVPLREHYEWHPLIRPAAFFLTPAVIRKIDGFFKK